MISSGSASTDLKKNMVDIEKERHSKRRRRNIVAKTLRDTGDLKGAFALRVINPKKPEYKRQKINVRHITTEEFQDE